MTHSNVSQPSIVPVVLAGGVGSRLWPLSRKTYPKQLLSILGQASMLQATLARVIPGDQLPLAKQVGIDTLAHTEWRIGDLMIIGSEDHRFLVQEQVDALGVDD